MNPVKLMLAFVMLFACTALAAEKPGSDPKKLPVGSIWEGTFKIEKGREVISDTLTIRITKREGNRFEGEWHQHNGKAKLEPKYEMEGTIAANDRVTITLVKLISGKGRDDKVGNTKITAQLANDGLDGTAFIPDSKWTMTWNAKLKKD